MRRLVAVLAFVALATVAWLLWPSEAGQAPVKGQATTASEPETTKSRAPRQHRESVAPVDDAPAPADAKAAEAEKKPAEETFPFTVTVLRADGSAAVGATVALVDPNAGGGTDNVVARGTSDDKGVATLPAPESSVRIAAWLGAEATASGEIVEIPGKDSLTVRMSPAMVVRGRVLRGDATPEPGADVEVSMVRWFGSEFGFALRTKSDADGRFEVPPIAVAGIDPLNPPNVEAITKDMARGFGEVDLAKPDAEIVVHLTPGFTVRGRFVDADGRPVAAELIAVGAQRKSATADADGRVTLRLPAAAYRFIARRTTTQSVISSRETGDPVVTQWRVGRLVSVRGDEETGDDELGEVVFPPGKPLKGLVVDTAGAPQKQAQVTLFLADYEIASVVTGDDGRFVLPEVSDDPHHLYAYATDSDHPDAEARRATADNVHGGDAELRVVVGESPAIAFRFLADGDRTPVGVVDVRVRAKLHGATDGTQTQSVGEPTSTFAIGVSAPGSYDVDVDVGGYESHHLESVEVVAGRRTPLDLLLRKKHE